VNVSQAFALALQHHQAGRLADAGTLYEQILAVQPGNAGALHHLGIIAHQLGQHDRAAELIGRSIAVHPNDPAAHSNLGEIHRALGRFDEAILSYRRALQLQPNDVEALNNWGIALRALGRFEESAAMYRRALEIKPEYPEILNNLGNTLRDLEELDAAATSFRRALQLHPEYLDAFNNLGLTLATQRRFDEAIAAYHGALQLRPEYAEVWKNLGNAWRDQARWEEAEASYRRSIACPGGSASAHFNLSLLLHLLGRHEEGWREYEWRWRSPAQARAVRDFIAPLWDGSPAEGRTILVHAEQGFGDTLQFVRYLPIILAHSRAARVIFECLPVMIPLLDQLRGEGIEIVARGASDEALPPFDLHLPLLSSPLALQRFAPLPMSAPYLRADAGLRARWRERLGTTAAFRVGLAWTGNPQHHDDRRRSIAPKTLAPLVRLPGIHFVSLQVGHGGRLPPTLLDAGVSDFTADIGDFADSAALMAELDLIITVDTATAHLAGALGRRVWLLLPFVPDWRWGLGREDTPWYSTMRLFRQPAAECWDTVISRVAEELTEAAGGKVSGK